MRRFNRELRPSAFGALFGVLAIGVGLLATRLAWWYGEVLRETPGLRAPFAQATLGGLNAVVFWMAVVVACGCLVAFAAAFIRRRWALSLVRKGCLLFYAGFWLYLYALLRVTSVLLAAKHPIHGGEPDAVIVFMVRWDWLRLPLLALLGVVIAHINLWRRSTINLYTGARDTAPEWGDAVVENARTHGRDPRYRKSWIGSVTTHLLVIVIIPWLLQMVGCVEPYRVPQGSGNPVVALVRMVKPKKEKKKKYILRPDSAIYFRVPDLDESKVLQDVKEMTELTYKADPNARAGKMGRGGGDKGGWPEGMGEGKVRFIRLEHRGPGWDDGMDPVNRADMNFLEEFNRLTGFKIGEHPESHPVRLLSKYDKGFAPPFVYLTGDGAVPLTEGDIRVLRAYLLDGGMLFADCGGPKFDRAFRGLMQATFPGEALLNIADDDPLFQFPYSFPNGAPPLWHHGGYRALGIKHKSRWVVFYHPGDINDAWKTGRSGLSPDMAQGAYQMGVNIIYYSFTHYLEQTRKYRK